MIPNWTTTTSMITEVLLQDKENLPTVTVGAVDPSIGSNVFVGNSDRFVAEGLLTKIGESVYRLTERGTEVCDSILEELV